MHEFPFPIAIVNGTFFSAKLHDRNGRRVANNNNNYYNNNNNYYNNNNNYSSVILTGGVTICIDTWLIAMLDHNPSVVQNISSNCTFKI